jgi:hypothetical protein
MNIPGFTALSSVALRKRSGTNSFKSAFPGGSGCANEAVDGESRFLRR